MKLRNAAAVGSMIVVLIGLSVIDVMGAESARGVVTEHISLTDASYTLRASSSTTLILEAERREVVVVELSGRTPETIARLRADSLPEVEVLEASLGRWLVALPQAGDYELLVEASGPFEVRIEAFRGRTVQPWFAESALNAPESPTALPPTEPAVEPTVEEPVDGSLEPTSPDSGEQSGGGTSETYNEDPVTVRWVPNQPEGQPGTQSATVHLHNVLVELPEAGIWMRVEQQGALRLPFSSQARVYALCDSSTSLLHLCAAPMVQGGSTQGDLRPADERRLHAFTLAAPAHIVLEGTGEPDLRGRLYEATGRMLAMDDDGGPALGFRFERQLPAGRYVLEVDAVAGGVGRYTLHLETTDTQP